MWIKPGQHGTSARHPSGHLPSLSQAASRRFQVRPQRGTSSSPPATKGTGTLATRGRTARERLSLGRTRSAL